MQKLQSWRCQDYLSQQHPPLPDLRIALRDINYRVVWLVERKETERENEWERESDTEWKTEREREQRKINAEMLLQKLSPPNHVILLYRGDAEALLDQVSYSSPVLDGWWWRCWKMCMCTGKAWKPGNSGFQTLNCFTSSTGKKTPLRF